MDDSGENVSDVVEPHTALEQYMLSCCELLVANGHPEAFSYPLKKLYALSNETRKRIGNETRAQTMGTYLAAAAIMSDDARKILNDFMDRL